MPEAWGTLTGRFADPRAAAAAAREAARPFGSEVQLVRPDVVVSARHLASAALHAQRAFAEGRNRADGLGLEFLCYLTGQRQFGQALARGGLAPGAGEAVAVALGGDARAALEAAAKALGARLATEVRWRGEPALAALQAPRSVGDPEARALELVALLDTER